MINIRSNMSVGMKIDNDEEEYTDCGVCHNSLPHCHCKCPYCGELNGCECALFDAATGG